MSRVAPLKAAAAAAFATLFSISSAQAIEAYVFRGMGDFSFVAKGLTFSDGMDRLAEKLEKSGIRANSYRWQEADGVYRDIMRRKPDAVAIMGHSAGAIASLALADRLKGTGIRVAYMGLIDIPGPIAPLPSNVEWAENFFHAYPVFGQLHKGPGHKGFISNEYILGEIHVTMDNSRRVHDSMISAIWMADAKSAAKNLHAYAPENRPAGEELVGKVEQVLAGQSDQSIKTASIRTGAESDAARQAAGPAAKKIHKTESGLPPID